MHYLLSYVYRAFSLAIFPQPALVLEADVWSVPHLPLLSVGEAIFSVHKKNKVARSMRTIPTSTSAYEELNTHSMYVKYLVRQKTCLGCKLAVLTMHGESKGS